MAWPRFVPIPARRPLFWSDEAVALLRVSLRLWLRLLACAERLGRHRLRGLAARRCASVRQSVAGAGPSVPRIAPCPLPGEMRGSRGGAPFQRQRKGR